MRISDWSSDVCASDLFRGRRPMFFQHQAQHSPLKRYTNVSNDHKRRAGWKGGSYVARNKPGIGRTSAAKKTVGFLLLGGMHHIIHLLPAAASLYSGIASLVFVTSEAEQATYPSILSKYVKPITLFFPSNIPLVT